MNHTRHLGNDVVDRDDPRCQGRAEDSRFLKRVFTTDEEAAVLDDPDPELALWMRWAGKEAAFKSVSKALGSPPVFDHSLFQVSALTPADPWPHLREGGAGTLHQEDAVLAGFAHFFSGAVRYRGMRFPLRVAVSPGAIHAVTWAREGSTNAPAAEADPPPFRAKLSSLPGAGEGWREKLGPRLTAMEWRCVPHEASALTRIAAKDALAEALGVDLETIEIGCGPGLPGRRIPRVFLEGEETAVDLTLSHHGRFQAWGFRAP
jgi:hypothetical protein